MKIVESREEVTRHLEHALSVELAPGADCSEQFPRSKLHHYDDLSFVSVTKYFIQNRDRTNKSITENSTDYRRYFSFFSIVSTFHFS